MGLLLLGFALALATLMGRPAKAADITLPTVSPTTRFMSKRKPWRAKPVGPTMSWHSAVVACYGKVNCRLPAMIS